MKPIYCSVEHEVLVEDYMTVVLEGVLPLVESETKKLELIDMIKSVIEYHNDYGEHYNNANFHDFLTIIPIQLSLLMSGILCGIQNNDNKLLVNIQKSVLINHTVALVNKLHKMKLQND